MRAAAPPTPCACAPSPCGAVAPVRGERCLSGVWRRRIDQHTSIERFSNSTFTNTSRQERRVDTHTRPDRERVRRFTSSSRHRYDQTGSDRLAGAGGDVARHACARASFAHTVLHVRALYAGARAPPRLTPHAHREGGVGGWVDGGRGEGLALVAGRRRAGPHSFSIAMVSSSLDCATEASLLGLG